jgi:dephospho-CoA kinase
MLKVVVGLTGTIGSGKNLVKEILMRKFNCYHVTLSDVIRGEAERKKPAFNRVTLQEMGNEMRRSYGTHILALLAIEYLPKDKEMIIVDGIRNPGEADYLRKKFRRGFVWIAVDAPQQTRFETAKQREQHNDPKNFEEFAALDERDQGKSEPEWGQQVGKCMEQADFVITNDGTQEQLEQKINEIFSKV